MDKKQLINIKKRTLILTQTNPDGDMMFDAWVQNGYNADIIFKPQTKIVRAIRRLWADNFLPGYSLWYGDWKKMLNDYDTVIVHADQRIRTVPGFIHKVKPDMRVIYWYWNPVNKASLPELTRDEKIECWTFDYNDSIKYSMKRNIQYYYGVDEYKNAPIEYDVYFVGHDKGRKDRIDKFSETAKNYGLVFRCDLVKDGQANIPYQKIQERIGKSRAILELNQAGQTGCTLRALEALFFEKKLITDNVSVKNEKFYSPYNIYILGQDEPEQLKDFVMSPYIPLEGVRDEYTIGAWFWNFFVEENM